LLPSSSLPALETLPVLGSAPEPAPVSFCEPFLPGADVEDAFDSGKVPK
jgi:hypothetical protein